MSTGWRTSIEAAGSIWNELPRDDEKRVTLGEWEARIAEKRMRFDAAVAALATYPANPFANPTAECDERRVRVAWAVRDADALFTELAKERTE